MSRKRQLAEQLNDNALLEELIEEYKAMKYSEFIKGCGDLTTIRAEAVAAGNLGGLIQNRTSEILRDD